jgi:hypothetical protein
VVPFQDVLFITKGTAWATKVYRKPTHTGWYLNFKSNHPPHVKREIIQRLHNRASTICQEWQGLFNEIGNLRCGLISLVIPKISLTWSLTWRLAVIWIKRKSLLVLCISHMRRAFQKS